MRQTLPPFRRTLNSILTGTLLLTGSLAISSACRGDSEVRQSLVCGEYCGAKADCNEGFDVDECVSRCKSGLGNCQADEVSTALDQLDVCADKECGELGLCKTASDVSCTLGL